ncbi:MAG: LuxR C-terminal-related transcriptional regulator [Chloroflexota bacterium]|nr:LuxR C-terminal-related transcriptional regulator [Chloroflexota bacterium]
MSTWGCRRRWASAPTLCPACARWLASSIPRPCRRPDCRRPYRRCCAPASERAAASQPASSTSTRRSGARACPTSTRSCCIASRGRPWATPCATRAPRRSTSRCAWTAATSACAYATTATGSRCNRLARCWRPGIWAWPCSSSARTVETYLSRLYKKMGVGNRAEAVAHAQREGLLTPEQVGEAGKED